MSRRAMDSSGHAELVEIVRRVRRRWRTKLALRGAAIVVAGSLAAFLAAAFVLDRFEFSPAAVVAARAVAALAMVVLIARFLVRPFLQRVTDERVALYLEEHEPSLQASVVGALEAGSLAEGSLSPTLVRRIVASAVERCRKVEEGRQIELRSNQRSAGIAAAVVAAGLALFVVSPPFIRQAATSMFLPFRDAAAATAVRIDVAPGNATVPRGADQAVSARLFGFASQRVELAVRAGADSAFERIPMVAVGDSGRYEFRLFDLDDEAEYFVESDGVRSPVFKISVADLPYVDRLSLELRFPAYSGLPPQTVEEGGDVAALAGTVVRLRAFPTMPVAAARAVFDDGRSVPLRPDSTGALVGEFRVQRPGFYHVELQPQGGEALEGSPQYIIDVLDDGAPSITFSKPGRDEQVTLVDEVYIEAKAEDDYGIAMMELVYSVNGAPEKTVPLYGARPLKEVSAGHTLYLEEMELEPGDFVSYYARATDSRRGESGTTTSDIYFLEIRPFGREYRQAEQAGMPGGGGGGEQGEDGDLSKRQREVIAATFNVVRDRDRYTDKEFQENVAVLKLTQDRLREQVGTLTQRMRNRGVIQDSSFNLIGQLLPQAAREMEAASAQLGQLQPQGALPPEQKALQYLQRAEAVYREVQVSMNQQGGGGQSASGSPPAEDLADLFGLELDKLRNQYETVQRGEQQAQQQQVDETLQRLKELARRQEQENERLRREAQSQQRQGGSGGSAAQRELAEQTEEAARQLERLSREQSRPDLMDAARRLQEAAEAMRRSAAGGRSGNLADASSAMDRLEEARRRLERERSSRVEGGIQDAQRQANQLAEEQREIAREMQELARGGQSGRERARQARELIDRKEQQANDVAGLRDQLDRMAAESREEQREASRKLQEAAQGIRNEQLEEKIRYSRTGTQTGVPEEFVRRFEGEISAGLNDLREKLGEAGGAVDHSSDREAEESLDRTRQLSRGLESLQERMRAARDEGREGEAKGGEQEGSEGEGEQQRGEGQQGEGRGGQQGQRGQQGARGGEGGQGQGGEERVARGGAVSAGGGWGGGGNIAPDQVRQFRGEVRQRLEEARELRERLAREGRDVEDLDEAIATLRKLDEERVYADWEELSRLQSAMVDRLKLFEFTLRQEIQGTTREKLFLSGAAEVPEAYRELVEEYYRALADQRRR